MDVKMDEEKRLNKVLSEAGVCSRREADRLIEGGRVFVDGQAANMGMKISSHQSVTVDGKRIRLGGEPEIVLAFYKPHGIVCTTDQREKNNIIDFINYERRIYPVGRLDKDSEGLILLTNNGELMDQILRSRNGHEKEYVVRVHCDVRTEILKAMEQGVPILDTITKPCRIRRLGKREFSITITQGLNRQIRRMCEYFDLRVVKLKRIRIMNIQLGDLQEGTYRNVLGRELDELKRAAKIVGTFQDGGKHGIAGKNERTRS